MTPAMTICMLLRLGFIFHIRRFGGAPVIQAVGRGFNLGVLCARSRVPAFVPRLGITVSCELSKRFFGFLLIILGYRKVGERSWLY